MRRKLHRAVIGGRHGFGGWFGRRRSCRHRDDGVGGRVLTGNGGVRLGLRSSPGRGMRSGRGMSLALRRLRPAPDTPIPRLPPEIPFRPMLRKLRRLRFHPRQPHIRRQRRRIWRLQQLRDQLQRNQRRDHHSGSFSHQLPANPKSHKLPRVQPRKLSPRLPYPTASRSSSMSRSWSSTQSPGLRE